MLQQKGFLDNTLAVLTCRSAVSTANPMQGSASMVALHTVHCKCLYVTYFLPICSLSSVCLCLYRKGYLLQLWTFTSLSMEPSTKFANPVCLTLQTRLLPDDLTLQTQPTS